LNREELIQTLSMPFIIRGVQAINLWEFIFILSFDLRICPPSCAIKIVKEGIKKELLSLTDQILRPITAILVTTPPLGFKPNVDNVEDAKEIKIPRPIRINEKTSKQQKNIRAKSQRNMLEYVE